MLEPIVKSIEVPCNQEKAFDTFVNRMDTWWPLDKFTISAMGGSPAKAIRVDTKPGGSIVEICADDTEFPWGTVKSYDPYELFSMDFHIPRPGKEPGTRALVPGETDESRTFVEVRFTVLSQDRTRVELTQSNWEAFGESAANVRGGYGGGWSVIFEKVYKAACGG